MFSNVFNATDKRTSRLVSSALKISRVLVLKLIFPVICLSIQKTCLFELSTSQAMCYFGNINIETGYMLLNNLPLTWVKLRCLQKSCFESHKKLRFITEAAE